MFLHTHIRSPGANWTKFRGIFRALFRRYAPRTEVVRGFTVSIAGKCGLAGFFRTGKNQQEIITKNYVINYEPTDKHSVLHLVRNFSNDIQVDKIEEDRVNITIELDDDAADELYNRLRNEVREMVDVRARHYTGD